MTTNDVAANASMTTNATDVAAACDSFEGWEVPVGVAMGVLGSIGMNVGQNMQATGVRSLPEAVQQFPWRSRTWLYGFAVFVSFAIINFSALSFAPASILVPIESLQFVSNVFYNRIVNQLRVSRRMYLGVLLAVVGTVLTVVFGAPGRCHSLEQMEVYWTNAGWWAFLAFSMPAALGAFVLHRRYRRHWREGHPLSPRLRRALPVSYSLYCALLGGSQLIVHAKVVATLGAMLLRGETRVLRSWLLYTELALMCLCGGLWGVKLTECLALYEPLLIIPLMVRAPPAVHLARCVA